MLNWVYFMLAGVSYVYHFHYTFTQKKRIQKLESFPSSDCL